MDSKLWTSAATGAALALLRDLLGQLRKRASTAAINEAADRIKQAVLIAPLDHLPPAQYGAAWTAMAEGMVHAVAAVGGLSEATRQKLHAAVGRKLVNAATRRLGEAADELLAKTDKWERLLK